MTAHSLNDNFDLFIGIDQTGALGPKGKAKPMPVAVLDGNHLRLTKASGPLLLSSFSCDGFTELAEAAGLDPKRMFSARTCIFVDCVFGLSEDVWSGPPGIKGLQKYFRKAAKQDSYGLHAAAKYFDSLRPKGSTEYFVRRCEVKSKANSVFRTHPYQKNIQCGTYRIWRDLGLDHKKDWYQIRYFTPTSQIRPERAWIFEAYPSLMWREHFGFNTRQPHNLATAIKTKLPQVTLATKDQERILESPDAADAAVLALSAMLTKEKRLLFREAPSKLSWLSREGWIIGLL